MDKKRTDLLKLQGEFQVKLRQLEKSLLQALNDSQGNILEDDHVIATLETLKREASEITAKVQETDLIMSEVNSVTSTYTPLAQACSSVFFVMEQLSFINHFYQFSLEFFMQVFDFILHGNPNLQNIKDFDQRLEILLRDLFFVSFERCSRSLLHADQLAFAMRLCYVKLQSANQEIDDREFDMLFDTDVAAVGINENLVAIVGEEIAQRVARLATIPAFKDLPASISSNASGWKDALNKDLPDFTTLWKLDSECEIEL